MSEVHMTWNGKEINDRVHKAAARGLRDGAEHLLTVANQTIPLETGEMMRGGIVDVDEQRLESSVSYGHNTSAAYVVNQHESTDYRHDEGRRAKWLEHALNEERSKIQRHIEKSISDELRG